MDMADPMEICETPHDQQRQGLPPYLAPLPSVDDVPSADERYHVPHGPVVWRFQNEKDWCPSADRLKCGITWGQAKRGVFSVYCGSRASDNKNARQTWDMRNYRIEAVEPVGSGMDAAELVDFRDALPDGAVLRAFSRLVVRLTWDGAAAERNSAETRWAAAKASRAASGARHRTWSRWDTDAKRQQQQAAAAPPRMLTRAEHDALSETERLAHVLSGGGVDPTEAELCDDIFYEKRKIPSRPQTH